MMTRQAIFFGGLLIIAGSVHGQDVCQKYEYVELNDFSKTELAKQYCEDLSFAKDEKKMFDYYASRAAGDRAYGINDLPKMTEHSRQRSQCVEEALSMGHVFKRKYKVDVSVYIQAVTDSPKNSAEKQSFEIFCKPELIELDDPTPSVFNMR
jgi:hypothetical protein